MANVSEQIGLIFSRFPRVLPVLTNVSDQENGAQKRTRTSTPLRAPAPEAGASTNSAIWARGRPRELGGGPVPVNLRPLANPGRTAQGSAHSKRRLHDGENGPAHHPVRRRRLHRPLCRPGPVQGRRPGPHRRARAAPRLLPQAARGLGQIQFVRADLADKGAVAAACQGADAVVNLVGILKGNFQAVHVDGARNVAEAAAAAGVPALVHVSAIGADPEERERLWRLQGRGRGGGARRLPRRHHPAPLDRVRAGGRFRQQVRPDGAAAAGPAGDPRRRGGCSRSMSPISARRSRSPRSIPTAHAGKTYELGGPEVLTWPS